MTTTLLVAVIALTAQAKTQRELAAEQFEEQYAQDCAARLSKKSAEGATPMQPVPGISFDSAAQKACQCFGRYVAASLPDFNYASTRRESMERGNTWLKEFMKMPSTLTERDRCFGQYFLGLEQKNGSGPAQAAAGQTADSGKARIWVASPQLFVEHRAGKTVYLTKDNTGKWSWSPTGDAREENTEAIIVDWPTRTIYASLGRSTSGSEADMCAFGLAPALVDAAEPSPHTSTNRITGNASNPNLRGNDRKKVGLTVCNSAFTSAKVGVSDVVTGIYQLALASRVARMQLDAEKLLTAASESGLLDAVDREETKLYRERFAVARTADELAAFMAQYRDSDPDGLILLAHEKWKVAAKEELVAACRQGLASATESTDYALVIGKCEDSPETYSFANEARVKQREALLREEAERNRVAEERNKDMERQAAQRRKQIDDWRAHLTVGDNSFCGRVIEIRNPMIKIALSRPLPGYPGEVWLHSNEMYPSTVAECQNTNNRFRPIFK